MNKQTKKISFSLMRRKTKRAIALLDIRIAALEKELESLQETKQFLLSFIEQ